MRRILFNVPNLKFAGGVALLYLALDLEKTGSCHYFYIHNTIREKNIFQVGLRMVKKYIQFFYQIESYDLVVLNPSFNRKSFLRESIFTLLAYLRNKKMVIFWHGWENEFEIGMRQSAILKMIFIKTFGKAKAFVILGSSFRNKLIDLGINKKKIFLHFFNVADDRFIDDFNIRDRLNSSRVFTLLFLSRIEKSKGVYMALDTFKLLQDTLIDTKFNLVIAGDGSELENVRKYIDKCNIENVTTTGFIDGAVKHSVYKNAHLCLFPSSYGEGLPLSVLEAMLYGLPVIARPVGGLPDVIKEGLNGYLIDSSDPSDYIERISMLLFNRQLYQSICFRNHEFALINLTAKRAKEKLISFLDSI
jgi:glycosyltransferase involved in cell wall biosynthesis